MGGLGSGGHPSVGRKPHDTVDDAPLDPVPIPADLPDGERDVWEELAPHATAMRTLSLQTQGAFRDLCELIVWRRKLLETIDKDGLTYVKVSVDGAGVEHSELKKHPLLAEYRGLMQRVEAGRARFRLAPMGKELPATKRDKPQSALEKLQAKQPRIRAIK